MQSPPNFALRAALLTAGLAGLSAAAPAQSLIETSAVMIAYSGDPVPDSTGTPIPNLTVALTTDAFDDVVMDASGKVFVRVRVADSMTAVTGVNDRVLLYGSSRSNMKLVARGGDQAPSLLPGVLLRTATGLSSGISGQVRITSDGRMFWGSVVDDAGASVSPSNSNVLFGGLFGAQAKVARNGDDIAPGTGGAQWAQSFASPTYNQMGMNDNGVAYFSATLVTGTGVPPVTTTGTANNQQGIWVGVPGGMELVARRADPVNGLGGEVGNPGTLTSFQSINHNDKLLFDVVLSTVTGAPMATLATDRALMVHTLGGGNALLLRESDPAPGTLGATFNSISTANSWQPQVGAAPWSNADRAIFISELRGGDVSGTSNDVGIFAGGVGTLGLVIRENDPAPGIVGANIAAFGFAAATHNAAGKVLFSSTVRDGGVTTANDSGLWFGPVGGLQIVAREGDAAPGAGGSTFGSLSGAVQHLNGADQVFFQNTLVGGGNPGISIWMWDATNGLRPVVLVGDVVEVTPGVFKTVSAIGGHNQNSNCDGTTLALTNNGQFAFRVNFSDNSRGVVRVLPGTLPVPYCFGDGSGTLCPCSPAPVPHGDPGKGCPNNLFAGGSQLIATGTASLRGDSLVLTANGMPNGFCTMFQGTGNLGGLGFVFGDGLRCANTVMSRLLTHPVVGNTSKYPDPSFGDNPISIRAMVIAPGPKYYQGWYRSANPAFCTPNTFNLSNGVAVTWAP